MAAAGGAESVSVVRELSLFHIMAGLLLVGIDLCIGGFRNHIFISRIKPGTGYSLSFRANVANMFMGAVTPSQGLGGPAQLAVLKLGGIPIGAAVSVSVINFIGTVLFFGAGVAAALLFFHRWTYSPVVNSVLWGCAVLFAAALLLLALALFKPSLVKMLLRGLAASAAGLFPSRRARIGQYAHLLERKVNDYHDWCLEFMYNRTPVVVLSVLLTVVIYLNKFTISWLIARGLGIDVSWGAMFPALYLVTFISYFAPSPGAGGIAEVATGVLLVHLLPGDTIPLFTLLNRMFILFLPAGVGFLAVMGTLRGAGGLKELLSEAEEQRR